MDKHNRIMSLLGYEFAEADEAGSLQAECA